MGSVRGVKDTKVLSEQGLFWLLKSDKKTVWGTLSIDEFNETTLETFGELIPESEDDLRTIVGQVKGGTESVTLIDCFSLNSKFPGIKSDGIDWNHQKIFVNRMLKGIQFEVGDDIAFQQAILDISSLSKWASPKVVEFTRSDDGKEVTVSKNERPDETARVSFKGSEIEITARFLPKEYWGSENSIRRYSIEDHCKLIVESADKNKISLDEILSVTGVIEDILSICCNETPIVKNLVLRHEKGDLFPIEALVPFRQNKQDLREGSARPALNLNDVGGNGRGSQVAGNLREIRIPNRTPHIQTGSTAMLTTKTSFQGCSQPWKGSWRERKTVPKPK